MFLEISELESLWVCEGDEHSRVVWWHQKQGGGHDSDIIAKRSLVCAHLLFKCVKLINHVTDLIKDHTLWLISLYRTRMMKLPTCCYSTKGKKDLSWILEACVCVWSDNSGSSSPLPEDSSSLDIRCDRAWHAVETSDSASLELSLALGAHRSSVSVMTVSRPLSLTTSKSKWWSTPVKFG